MIEITPRRKQILLLICLIAAVAGTMVWMGLSPMQAIINGVQDAAPAKKPDVPLPGPDTPTLPVNPTPAPTPPVNPTPAPTPSDQPKAPLHILIPDAPSPLERAARDAIPSSAPQIEINEVAAVFRDIATSITNGKMYKKPNGTNIPLPTPEAVLEATRDRLSEVLSSGSSRDNWTSFSTKLAQALDTYQKSSKLATPEDFVSPWNQIAGGLQKSGGR